MKHYLFFYSFILCLCITWPSYAQSTSVKNPQTKLFEQFITRDKQYIALLKLESERVFQVGLPQCEDALEYTRIKPNILLTPKFIIPKKINNQEDDSHSNDKEEIKPSHGQWIEKAIIKGCGQTIQTNQIITAFDSKEHPSILPLINGQTKIPVIFHDTVEKLIKEKIEQPPTTCHSDIFIKNTGLIGYRSEDGQKLLQENQHRGWFERWIIDACRAEHSLTIAVLPDPKTHYRFIVKILSPKK